MDSNQLALCVLVAVSCMLVAYVALGGEVLHNYTGAYGAQHGGSMFGSRGMTATPAQISSAHPSNMVKTVGRRIAGTQGPK